MSISVPDIVDVKIGANLRAIRKAHAKSQTQVGDAVGYTFQQVQKYERGANRISAPVLQTLSIYFGVPVEAFFAGLPRPDGAPDNDGLKLAGDFYRFVGEEGALDLVRQWLGMSKTMRRGALEVVRSMARETQRAA